MSENGTVNEWPSAEARLCVSFEEHLLNFSEKRQNLTLLDGREILRRISSFIRNMENGTKVSKNVIEDFKFFPEEEETKVCIVWNPQTKQIRFSVSGMAGWEAAILCDNAAALYDKLLINLERVTSEEVSGEVSEG